MNDEVKTEDGCLYFIVHRSAFILAFLCYYPTASLRPRMSVCKTPREKCRLTR